MSNTACCSNLGRVTNFRVVAEKRPQVPKLNDSDVPLQNKPCDDAAVEKEAVRKKRANSRKNLKKSIATTNDIIIKAHSLISQRSNGSSKTEDRYRKRPLQKNCDISNASNSKDKSEDEYENENDDMNEGENEHSDMNEDSDEDTDKDNLYDDEDMDNSDAVSDESSIKEKDNDGGLSPPLSQTSIHYGQFHNCGSPAAYKDLNDERYINNDLLEEVQPLKNVVTKLKTDKLEASKVIKKLQEKCNSSQNVIGNLKNKGSNQIQKKLKSKGFPLPICTNSNIMVRADVLEDAYTKLRPIIFYEHFCYAAWSKKDLAKRYVKKTKKTPDHLIKMTPRKRRAIKEHFIHYLRYYKYHTVLFAKEIGNTNCYTHRAITAAKKHRKTVDQYPELSSDKEIDVDKMEL